MKIEKSFIEKYNIQPWQQKIMEHLISGKKLTCKLPPFRRYYTHDEIKALKSLTEGIKFSGVILDEFKGIDL